MIGNVYDPAFPPQLGNRIWVHVESKAFVGESNTHPKDVSYEVRGMVIGVNGSRVTVRSPEGDDTIDLACPTVKLREQTSFAPAA